ncbi:hypothetical protein BN1058_00400 [Paraliobacillus sp. PM-2]|uniref:hypothetical protein n=1 Tax=Paraliobacillus sp. PM-2 TaxID=1462524 RepID=UPI00061CAB8B|nr:hypothetical protein [Paraliobacillus sp. PM-2]CQR46151.1 hypothetical protein BN1058_00400 [Paraliobacillus sp. PM-2]
MECIKASELTRDVWEEFFYHQLPANLTEEDIHAYGYFIKEDVMHAFFMLVPVKDNGVQLKHLYMKEKLAPMYILAIIEVCIQLVKTKQLKYMFIYSEQDALNQLLKQLHFEPVTSPPDNQQKPGKWWGIVVDNAEVY